MHGGGLPADLLEEGLIAGHFRFHVRIFTTEVFLFELGCLQPASGLLESFLGFVSVFFRRHFILNRRLFLGSTHLKPGFFLTDIGFEGRLGLNRCIQFLGDAADVRIEGRQFVFLDQNPRCGIAAATDQHFPGGHHLAVRCNNRLAQRRISMYPDGILQIVGQNHVTDQGFGHGLVFRPDIDMVDQAVCRDILYFSRGSDGIERNKPTAAGLPVFQICDGLQGREHIGCQQILKGFSHGCGQRRLMIGRCVDDVCHRPDDAGQLRCIAAG